MPGINIQSVRPSPNADTSFQPPAPVPGPQQSFMDVQQQVSGQWGSSGGLTSPAGASGNSSPSMNDAPSQASANSDSQAPASQSANADNSGSQPASNPPDNANQSNDANQSTGNSQANSSASDSRQAQSSDAQQGQAKKAADDNTRSAKTDSKKKADGKQGDTSNSDAKDAKDTKDQQAVAVAAPVQMLEQQKVDIKGARSKRSTKTDPVKLDLSNLSGQGGKGDKSITKSNTSAGSKTANALEQMLEKAVAKGAKNGDGKTGQEALAAGLGKGGFGQQLQLQGFNGQGASFQLAGTGNSPAAAGASPGQAASGGGLSQYSTNVDLPMQHAEWGNQIAGKVTWMANQKIQTADIHVNPPDLGPVHVQMQVHNNQASVTMHSQHPEVRQLLQDSGDKLKDMMQQGGMSLSNFDVSSQSGQQQDQQSPSGGTGSGRGGSAAVEIGSSGELASNQSGQMTVSWNRLDLYA